MKTIMLLLVGTALTCFVAGHGCILSPGVDCELSLYGEDGAGRRWSTSAEASGKDKDDCWAKACARTQRSTQRSARGVFCSPEAGEIVCDCGYNFRWLE